MGSKMSKPGRGGNPLLAARVRKPTPYKSPSRNRPPYSTPNSPSPVNLTRTTLQVATSLHLGQSVRSTLLPLTPPQRARVRCAIHIHHPTLLDYWPSEQTLAFWEYERCEEERREQGRRWEEEFSRDINTLGLTEAMRRREEQYRETPRARATGLDKELPQIPESAHLPSAGLKRTNAIRSITGTLHAQPGQQAHITSIGLHRTNTPRLRPGHSGVLRVVNPDETESPEPRLPSLPERTSGSGFWF
ncbi:uncharacterized protein KY384_007334 [Bacidia gigantensis]|uniref:uncharacterized protein n=1 Tax=Bacidia gigantensis TaxID=2732470 RepID=UPI001D04F73D|nr:uncharacterized protein KY384_007334 [Bacidia gigantensis]KAG8528416.1 hypothetical protein KY384_007334 [Bacidia gigantensis]